MSFQKSREEKLNLVGNLVRKYAQQTGSCGKGPVSEREGGGRGEREERREGGGGGGCRLPVF